MVRSLLIDETGQDLIEYALLAGFVAVAASAILPDVMESVKRVFTKVREALAVADGGSARQ